jgi:hypothetical protein
MSDLSLPVIANIAEIVGASTIVTGMIFGWIQLRHYRIQHRDAIAQSLMQTFYNRDFAAAIALLQLVPDGIRLSELRTMGSEYDAAAVTVTTSFETMGILVFKGIAPLDLVVDLAGGIIMTMNCKLARYEEELRIELDQPSWGEWFTWLGDQVERVKTESDPAFIQYRDWRP